MQIENKNDETVKKEENSSKARKQTFILVLLIIVTVFFCSVAVIVASIVVSQSDFAASQETPSPTKNPTTLNPTTSPTTQNPTKSPILLPTQSPTQSPTVTSLPLSSTELRDENDHVGVLFAVEPNDVERAAFVNAARRWSDIVAGTVVQGGRVDSGVSFCDLPPFSDTFILDHLMIISQVVPIDGRGNVLAQAGPCIFDTLAGSESNFPIIGIMTFDSDDIVELIIDGTFETVILHEMGHVLGVGALWSFATQGNINVFNFTDIEDSLLINPVFSPFDGSLTGFTGRPEFVGENGVTQFGLAGGIGNVPVEDGLNSFASGRGSIDSHWEINVFDNELMVFAINSNNANFPLSAVTIGSLQDLGYTVDLSFADPFTVSTAVTKSKVVVENTMHYLVNDILTFEYKSLDDL